MIVTDVSFDVSSYFVGLWADGQSDVYGELISELPNFSQLRASNFLTVDINFS